MHWDCGMFNVVDRVTLVKFVGIDKTVTKEKTVVYLHKTKGVKDKFSMDMVTIRDLLLDVKVFKMWRGRSSICFVEDDMHKVNVGPKYKVMVVAIVGETILWTSVINEIRLSVCLIRWPIHNNKRGTT